MIQFLTEKKDIIDWLDKYKISNYNLMPDTKYGFKVDVDGDIELSGKKLDFIPVKFNTVNGFFSCFGNKLTSLEFAPLIIKKGFSCSKNKLTSLEFCPEKVNGDFSCSYNKLITLEFCPKIVTGEFWCDNNKLTSLEFCPQEVGHIFWCEKNPKLGVFQDVIDFDIIYRKHLSIKIKNFEDNLNNKLINNSFNTKKIKL